MSKPETKMRWSKFWWGDWQNDAALKMCSYAARGLWLEMLAIMHAAEQQGFLLVNGRLPSPRQVAAITGGAEKEVVRLLAELEEAGVFSRDEAGVIFSRRMVRDKAASEEGRANGSRGGNPALTSKDKTPPYGGGLTPPVDVGVKLEAEAEAEEEAEEERKKDPPTPRSRGAVRGQAGIAGFEEFWRHYPRRVAKGEAEKAWPAAVKASGGDPGVVVDGLKIRLHITELFDPREDGRYIPHPATWLRRKGWEDAIPGFEPEPENNPSLPFH
jgi:hypothetical protein